jgi:hypothetical protein
MKLATNKEWALRALQIIYNQQTEDEQASGQTRYHNNVGFSGTDSDFLSSLARQHRERGWLTRNQMKHLHKIMPKYWNQILQLSDREKLENMIRV